MLSAPAERNANHESRRDGAIHCHSNGTLLSDAGIREQCGGECKALDARTLAGTLYATPPCNARDTGLNGRVTDFGVDPDPQEGPRVPS